MVALLQFAMVASFLAAFALIGLWLAVTHRCFRRLHEKHPAVFVRLQCPGFAPPNGFPDLRAFDEFARSEEYRSLADPALDALFARRRKLKRGITVVFPLAIGLFFIAGISNVATAR